MRIFLSVLTITLGFALWMPLKADVQRHVIDEDYTFVQVQNDSWKPDEFDDGIYIPTPHMIQPNIILDGIDDELEWRRTTEAVVPLVFGNVKETFVKALYTDTDIYITIYINKW